MQGRVEESVDQGLWKFKTQNNTLKYLADVSEWSAVEHYEEDFDQESWDIPDPKCHARKIDYLDHYEGR